MSQRYDIWVRALDGPTRGQDVRGTGQNNVVDLGKSPPPGGIRLPVRSLAPVHARVQISEGQAVIVPMGTQPVRLAPHGNVDWSRVDPLHEPAWWNPGGAIYLGRPGSGVALELVRVEALGAWQGGPTTTAVSPTAPRRITVPRLPLIAVGCSTVLVTMTMAIAVAIWLIATRPPAPIAAKVTEAEAFDFVDDVESSTLLEEDDQTAMDKAWSLLVVRPSIDNAGPDALDEGERRRRESWDEVVFERFVASAEKHAGSLTFYRRVEETRKAYARVMSEVERTELPEIVAAIPMTEARYRNDKRSVTCAAGMWQLMPEVGHRLGLDIGRCEIEKVTGEVGSLEITGRAVPRGAPYVRIDDGVFTCLMTAKGCTPDDRKRPGRATPAALRSLQEAWEHPVIRDSGASVMLTVLSHNAGLDDAKYGVKRRTNILPAYRAWTEDQDRSAWHRFYGENIKCQGGHDKLRATCGGKLPAQSQHYGYTVAAQHLVAMCYLGRWYGDDPAFVSWEDRARADGGVCSRFAVPSPSEVK